MIRVVSLLCLAAVACFLSFSEAPAQAGSGNASLGIVLGSGFSTWNGADASLGPSVSKSRRAGLALGIVGQQHITPTVSALSTVLYTSKGVTYSGLARPVDVKLAYIEIDAAIRFSLGGAWHQSNDAQQIGFFIDMGIYMALLGQARMEASGVSLDVKELLEDFDLGGVLGGGISVPMGGYSLQAALHLKPGLFSIDRGLDDIKNNSLVLSGTLMF